ncbi:MAG: InlB B-repeat-containing protein, partial [Alphaproteobacteria bacterium]|nr:InlB B-repeat-containing protein [Alphaproteobacteria bacterium]
TSSAVSGYTSGGKWVTTTARTLYAQFSCNEGYGYNSSTDACEAYTITFKTGNGTMGTQLCAYGENVALNAVSGMTNIPVAANKGWSFDGWATSVNTTASNYANQGTMTCNGNATLYGIWKRDVKFTYYETATSTSKKTSTSQQYYRNTTASAASVNSVDTYPLYVQTDYAWSPLGWATTTSATSASTSQTGATTTTVSPALGTGSSTGVAYYAIYSRTPQIAYNGNGNTGGSTANTNCGAQTFNAGATNGSTPTCTLANNGFTRTGYTFDKWAAGGATGTQYSEGDAYTFTNQTWTSAKTYTMYANWKNNHYRITLNDAGGNGGQAAENPAWGLYERYGICYIAAQVLNNTELEASDCVTSIYATPTKQGYDFGGYYTGENGTGDPVIDNLGTIVAPATQFTEDSTVYAKWTASTYNINYVFNGGSAIPSEYMPVEYIQSAGNSYIDTGYTFENLTKPKLIVDTLYTAFSGWNMHGVSGSAFGGPNVGVSSDQYLAAATNGDKKSTVKAAVNTRYLFDLDVPAGTFVVKNVLTGATLVDMTGMTTTNRAVTKPTFKLFGYETTNNSIVKNKSRIYSAKLYDDGVLVRNYVPARYGNVCGLYDTVSGSFFQSATNTPFDCPNTEYIGGYPDSYTYGIGADITGVPTRANSTFVGWCENSGLTNNCVTPQRVSTTATGDKTFYAKWTCNTGYTANSGNTACNPNTINLTYVSEHGTAPQSPNSCIYDQNVTLPAAVTANGYTFSKWGVAGNQFDADETIVCNSANLGVASGTATVTAVWTTNDYTMQYICSDGTESANWTFDGTAPTATNPVHYGDNNVTMEADPYNSQTGCRKIWNVQGEYCDNCFTFGGWTIDAESTAIPTAPAHAANSNVNPWGSTGGTDWCIVNTTGVCSAYSADDTFLVRPQYTPKQYDIEYVYATSPANNNASMPASYTYTYVTTVDNADQTPPAHATFNGWCTDLNEPSTCVGANQSITIGNREHGDKRYYANWSCDTGYDLSYNANNEPVCSASSITCDPTQYLPANSVTCVDCTAGNYCPGGTFTFNENNAQGINICPAGSFCPAVVANHTLCAIGSYTSTTGQSVCVACQDGTTTSATGQTSCDADCANATGAMAWDTATWQSNNTVSNLCVLNRCEAGYYPLVNNSGNVCALCADFADGLYPRSVSTGVTVESVSTNYGGDGRRACFLFKKDINGYHIEEPYDEVKTPCPAGTYTNYPYNHTAAVHYGESYVCDTCPANTYSGIGATSCDSCLTNYVAPEGSTSVSDCEIHCDGGYYIETANDTECSAVGAGHWAAESWTPQGQAGSYTNCAAGLTTIGYGVGADEAGDCGRVLHVGANHIYLRSDRKTDKTLNVKIGGTLLYGNMANAEVNMSDNVDHALKIKVGNTTYSVYDDSGEVYIGTSGGSGITINPNIAASSTTPSSYNTASGMSWSAEVDEMTVSGTGGCSTTTGSNGDISAAGFSPNGSGTGCWCQITSPTQSNRWVYATTNSSCSTKCGFYCANTMKGTSAKNITYRTNLYSVSDLL